MDATRQGRGGGRTVRVPAGSVTLEGDLDVPSKARGAVLFAYGSGSSRHSSRNRFVAGRPQEWGLATLLIDLLTRGEESVDVRTARWRFDIGLLAERLVGDTDWLAEDPDTRGLKVGYFGASTGGTALVAAAERPNIVGGGRFPRRSARLCGPDLAPRPGADAPDRRRE